MPIFSGRTRLAPDPPPPVLRKRLITGPILIATLLAVVVLDDWVDTIALPAGFFQDLFRGKEHPPRGIVLFLVALGLAPLCARELTAIFRTNGIMTRTWLTTLATVVGLVLCYSIPTQTSTSPGTETTTTIALVTTSMIVVFVIAILTFSRRQNVAGVIAAAGAVMFAMVYLGFMLGLLLALRREHSAWIVVGVIFVTKACDTGAYFTGRAIGRHRMIPWLSPGKTWEGLAGGIATAVVTGVAFSFASRLLDPIDHVAPWIGAVCGALFGVVGQLGDLTMGLFKRGAGLKDSSAMLPGLGGVLDLLDSPLLVAPVAWWTLTILPA